MMKRVRVAVLTLVCLMSISSLLAEQTTVSFEVRAT